MAVQLQITLPLDWVSDFDRVTERWYFYHRPSGFCQYLLPKNGDEITRAAELLPRLPPRPAQTSITTAMEAMSIVQDKQQSTVTAVVVQQTQPPAAMVDSPQVMQRRVSTLQYAQQTPLAPGTAPQQNVPAPIPNATPVRRTSGAVSRKPLPRQNSAPQQQSQASIQQRQDSQISPRSSVSQTSIRESTSQQVLQQPMQSPRNSLSQNSIAELPLHQALPIQQTQQQPIQSPRSSVSQTSIAESPLQHTHPQPMPTSGASFQNQSQNPHGAVQPAQQPTSPQYTTTTFQSPVPIAGQEQTSEQVESSQVPVENNAVFWSEGFIESTQSPYAKSGRPKLANRLSSSAIKMPQKAYSASKDYIKAHPDAIKMPQKAYSASRDYMKAHPGKTTAIAGGILGGIGVVGEACGMNGFSDAVAASKIYLNVQRANQRKRKVHSLPQHAAQSTTHNATPRNATAHNATPRNATAHNATAHNATAHNATAHNATPHNTTPHNTTAGVAQNHSSPTTTSGPSATEVAKELFKMMQQQGQLPSPGQNATPQNNNSQPPNQGGTSNAQASSQQYYQPQYTQPQYIPVQVPVNPIVPGASVPFNVPPFQVNQVQTSPAPSIAGYQPPPSPPLPTGTQTPPSPSQYPTPPLSFSDPLSQSPPPFDPSTLSPDPSTLQYDQFLQDQTSTTIANQAIFNSQAFTTSLTGQDMFVPSSFGQSDNCSMSDMPLQTTDDTGDVSDSWAGQDDTVDDYSCDDDDGCGYNSC